MRVKKGQWGELKETYVDLKEGLTVDRNMHRERGMCRQTERHK